MLQPFFFARKFEMNRDVVIEPKRFKGEAAIPTWGILAVNPGDEKWLEELAGIKSLKRQYLFHSRLYRSAGSFLAGPAVGAPMATICLEKLIALGARKIILYGWCGSLVPELTVGELLVPTLAVSEEGTSRHYPGSVKIEADASLRYELMCCLDRSGLAYHCGPIWTTDAPYRETKEKIISYAQQAVLGVDMEFAALCSVAAFRKVQLAALMLVSDELWRDPWKAHFGDKKFKENSRQVIKTVSAWLDEVNV